MALRLILLAIIVTLNGFFAAAEVALVAWRAAGLALWRDVVGAAAAGGPDGAADPGPAALGRIAAGLQDTRLRDAVVVSCVPGSGDAPDRCLVGGGGARDVVVGEAVQAIVDPVVGIAPADETAVQEALLRRVVAHARRRDQAPALTLLGLLAWWQGDGARASVLVGRALSLDPAHRLGLLLDDMLQAGLPPGWAARRRSTG